MDPLKSTNWSAEYCIVDLLLPWENKVIGNEVSDVLNTYLYIVDIVTDSSEFIELIVIKLPIVYRNLLNPLHNFTQITWESWTADEEEVPHNTWHADCPKLFLSHPFSSIVSFYAMFTTSSGTYFKSREKYVM